MTRLLGWISLYIDCSLHVAFSVLAFTCITFLELGIPSSCDLLYFVFFSTIAGYNFVKYYGFLASYTTNPNWRINVIGILSLVSLGIAFFFFQKLNLISICTVVVLALLTFFYAIPIPAANYLKIGVRGLRGFSGFKVFIIALVWSFATVFLPFSESKFAVSSSLYVLLITRFLWVLVLMIPFEIRDLEHDDSSLGTLPQKLGVEGAKYLGYVLLLIICIVSFVTVPVLKISLVTGSVALVSALCIWGARINQGPFYSALWVETIPVFWLGLLLIFS